MQIIRRIIQAGATLGVNSAFLFGQYLPNGLYPGPLKQICSPGLNCYACPYAVAACPIGSLQYFIGHGTYHFSIYIGGFLLLMGALFGRLICGWICPFGLFQDVLYKVKSPKARLPHPLRHLRWIVLVGLVGLLPLLTGKPSFCSFVCPAGTLQGGIPFSIFSAQVRNLIGPLFFLKLSLLFLFIAGSVFIFRFFCQTACPLGLIYGFFNRLAVLGLDFDPDRCINCGLCVKACPMGLKPEKGEYLSGSCVRCFKCSDACPQSCFRFGLTRGKERSHVPPETAL